MTTQVLQGRYVLQSVLADGGMSRVYLAVDQRFGRRVAVKQMGNWVNGDAERRQVMDQFQQEAQMLSALDHPGLVPVYDYFIEDQNHFLVMAFIDGRTLQTVIDVEGVPPVARALRWMDDLCSVSEYLHGNTPPIVFRDMKPANIMLDANGRVRLIDFGIASAVNADSSSMFDTAGTAGYAPLEQRCGAVDARADIYALGATAYTLLTGHIPPEAVSILIGEDMLESPREQNPALSVELEKVIFKMMALYREDRYQSISDVRRALRKVPEFPPAEAASGRMLKAYRCAHCGAVKGVAEDCPNCERSKRPAPGAEAVSATPGSYRVVLVLRSDRQDQGDSTQSVRQRAARAGLEGQVWLEDDPRLPSLSPLTPDWRMAVVSTDGHNICRPAYFVSALATEAEAAAALDRAVALAKSWPPSGAEETVNPVDGSLMVRVAGGPSLMGDRMKRHRVILPDFYIGRHPITNGQFRSYLQATGRTPNPRWQQYCDKHGDDVPTAQASWFEALAYAQWAGARLPTGAEWEKAASRETGRWPWGDTFDPALCRTAVGLDTVATKGPVPIGLHPLGASPAGCEDMLGNVWEWCSSKFRPYPYASDDGREEAGGMDPREIRGGSWANAHVATLGVTVREGIRPDRSYDYVGFRLARVNG